MAVSYRVLTGCVALPLETRGVGTYTSDDLFNPDLDAAFIMLLFINVSAVSGAPTLACSFETSTDGITWTALSDGPVSTLTTPGDVLAVTTSLADYIRVTSTVSGADEPDVTYRLFVVVPVE